MLVTDVTSEMLELGYLDDLSKNERKVLTFHVVNNITVAIVCSGHSVVNDLMMVTVKTLVVSLLCKS